MKTPTQAACKLTNCDEFGKRCLKGFWSVTISGNWRIVFRFEGEAACDIDLIDYH